MPIPEELELQQAVYPASCSKGAAVTPDDGRQFTELYNVQHLQSAQRDRVSRVCISTIQRLYSMLRGEEIDPEIDERSGYELSNNVAQASSLWGQRGVPPVASLLRQEPLP